MGPYDFDSWKYKFTDEIREKYEKLHLTLLYTSEMQCFEDAIKSLAYINSIFIEIGE